MRARRACGGFSLVELIVVIVLMGFLAAVSANLIADTMTASYTATNNAASGSAARYAAERITREVRELAYGTTGGYTISTWTSTSFAFTKQDGTVVTITGTPSATPGAGTLTLRYTSVGAAQTLATGVSAFAFSYLDQLGATTTDKEDIRYVQLTMSIQNAKTLKTDSLRTRIFLRNAQYMS
jgi:prepilin-type N-terminal cleavage/methylation domain-containing protein